MIKILHLTLTTTIYLVAIAFILQEFYICLLSINIMVLCKAVSNSTRHCLSNQKLFQI